MAEDTGIDGSVVGNVSGTSGTNGTSETSSNAALPPDRHGFLRGSQYGTNVAPVCVPAEQIIRREQKWLKMFNEWDVYMTVKFPKLRSRCYKGIPASVRPRAWYYLSGAKLVADECPGHYESLLKGGGNAKCLDEITRDLHRQFPFHEMFTAREGVGQQELFNVLKAYSIQNQSVGYCQAQAPLAAFLLIHMPAEQAFWCLISICDRYLQGYYSKSMDLIQLDGAILFGLLKKVSPPVYRHLKKQEIDPILYMTEWMLCAYIRNLPWLTVLRLWDIFLCEGVKVLFKAGLVIMKHTLQSDAVRRSCQSMCETLDKLRHPPDHILEHNFFIAKLEKLKIGEEDLRKEHIKQEKLRNKKNSHKSSKSAKKVNN